MTGLLPLLPIGGLLCVPPAAGFSGRQLPGSCLTGAMTRLMGELQTSTIRVSRQSSSRGLTMRHPRIFIADIALAAGGDLGY
jgi:hypothetical protein